MTKRSLIYLLTVLMMTLQACSDSEMSPEDEIRQYIESGVEAAEARSASDLADLIHSSYRDPRGYGRTQIEKLAKLYFFRHRNIHLFTKINEIDFLSPGEAQVTLHVAMAGNVISDASVLASLRARIYRFELLLVKDETWLLQQAQWQPAGVGDME
ncbi:MAG: hypothetical protein GY763_12490 [Gammaproteobacteria bacterium]|nr:hypothetical protein [Gammaproteobacteria bacterium]